MTIPNPILAQHIELWPVDRLRPYARNARTHSDSQVAEIAASIVEFGFVNPILVHTDAGIIAGHGRLLAARKLGLAEVPVVVLDHLNASQRRAYILADNKIALNAGWDDALLAEEVRALQTEGFDLDLAGFPGDELDVLLKVPEQPESASDASEEIGEAPAVAVTRLGDLWRIGKHRLVCGDCRDRNTVGILFPPDARAAVCITSPPYAGQRVYDTSTSFRPVPPDDYTEWYRAVADNVVAILAEDGSYLLNIKEHSEDGERSLYVKDLVIAHRRQWGWRFVDEFCWRNTANGVPGKWPNRLKNAWEPVFHFSRSKDIKFRPKAAGHLSADVVVYSPANPSAVSGSGLLGSGSDTVSGIAWPSNVIEVKAEGGQGSHSAPFPRPLVEFFIKAFSDPGDCIFDPFMGSGTTMAAAHVLGRAGYGCEISPGYCDLTLKRVAHLGGGDPVLAETGQSFDTVAQARGVAVEQAAQGRAA